MPFWDLLPGAELTVWFTVDDWEALIEWLEDLEDTRLARAALADLKVAGGDRSRAGWLKWQDVEHDLE